MRAAPAKRSALLGIFAVLFQAILFGWHHHDLILPPDGLQPAAIANGAAPFSPLTAEDDCDICQALHHLTGAAAEFVALAAPATAAAPMPLPNPTRVDPNLRGAFQARAPPPA